MDRRKAVRFLFLPLNSGHWGCSRRGAVSTGGMRPPFSFWSCPKRERAAPGVREKGALTRSGAVALRARRGSAYRCKRRFGPAFGHAWAFCGVDTAVPWRMVRLRSGCKNAFDQLLFPRVPLRYALPWRSWGSVPAGGCGHPPLRQDYGFPRSRRGRCLHRPVAEAPSTTKPAAAKSGAGCIPDFPGPKVTPRATRFRL